MRPECNLDLCCYAEEGNGSHPHSVLPTVCPAPRQVRKSGSEGLLALLLWQFAVLLFHKDV